MSIGFSCLQLIDDKDNNNHHYNYQHGYYEFVARIEYNAFTLASAGFLVLAVDLV